MGNRLEGKVAIVTGAGSDGEGIGNGKATAVLFAREGARVGLVDNVPARAEETLGMIQSEGGQAFVIGADLSNAKDCEGMVQTIVERYGRLDILHNNVGISRRGTVLEVDEETWDLVMSVNLKSVMLASRFAIPVMKENGGGVIINVASTAGLRAHSANSSTAYTASKGGIIALTHSMAADHGRDGIRVNCIAPGLVETPMFEAVASEEGRAIRRSATPLGTPGTGWDVGWAAVYLASNEARWVTGVVLPVDGGLTVTTPATYMRWRPGETG